MVEAIVTGRLEAVSDRFQVTLAVLTLTKDH
ncbi:MAG: hypothetical protein ACI9BK_002543, partial [Acidimicrobiales bacterium]